MKYNDWLLQWLYYKKPNLKYCTYTRYVSFVKVQVSPILGEYELEELTAQVLQRFIALLAERYAPGTIKNAVALVKGTLTYAEEMEVVEKQNSSKMRFREKKRTEIQVLNKAEQKKLEDYIIYKQKPKLYGMFICLYTGLRVGELMALKWSDIDFKNCILHVNKTCHDTYEEGYKKLIDTPKTYSSKREIPFPKQLIHYLKILKSSSQSDYVISGNEGKVISKRSYQNTFTLLIKKLGLPDMGIHSLRHTFATRALECGMDIKTLSEILGHSDPSITLKYYAHSLPEHKRLMMSKVGKMLQ